MARRGRRQNKVLAGMPWIVAAAWAEMDEVPVFVADGWTDVEKTLFTVGYHRIIELSHFNIDRLTTCLESWPTEMEKGPEEMGFEDIVKAIEYREKAPPPAPLTEEERETVVCMSCGHLFPPNFGEDVEDAI